MYKSLNGILSITLEDTYIHRINLPSKGNNSQGLLRNSLKKIEGGFRV